MNTDTITKPKLTVIKGGRQSGKTSYILSNLDGANVIIFPNVMMAKMVLDRYVRNQYNQKSCLISAHTTSDEIAVVRTEYYYDAPRKGMENFTVFTSAQVAYHALETLLQQRFYNRLKVWVDEANMIQINRLDRIVQYCQEANLELVATLTPTVITPKNVYKAGWLHLGQWYDAITYIELPAYTNWGIDFKSQLPPNVFKTEILGEYVLADDDPTPQPRLPKGKFA